MTRYRHKRRGTEYEVITDSASLQCSTDPETEHLFEDDVWTVYRNVKTGAYHVRLTPEFNDGRYEKIEDGMRGS